MLRCRHRTLWLVSFLLLAGATGLSLHFLVLHPRYTNRTHMQFRSLSFTPPSGLVGSCQLPDGTFCIWTYADLFEANSFSVPIAGRALGPMLVRGSTAECLVWGEAQWSDDGMYFDFPFYMFKSQEGLIDTMYGVGASNIEGRSYAWFPWGLIEGTEHLFLSSNGASRKYALMDMSNAREIREYGSRISGGAIGEQQGRMLVSAAFGPDRNYFLSGESWKRKSVLRLWRIAPFSEQEWIDLDGRIQDIVPSGENRHVNITMYMGTAVHPFKRVRCFDDDWLPALTVLAESGLPDAEDVGNTRDAHRRDGLRMWSTRNPPELKILADGGTGLEDAVTLPIYLQDPLRWDFLLSETGDVLVTRADRDAFRVHQIESAEVVCIAEYRLAVSASNGSLRIERSECANSANNKRQ